MRGFQFSLARSASVAAAPKNSGKIIFQFSLARSVPPNLITFFCLENTFNSLLRDQEDEDGGHPCYMEWCFQFSLARSDLYPNRIEIILSRLSILSCEISL